MLLDNAANGDAAQYEALHKLPMTEVLYRVERWLNTIFASKEQAKKMASLKGNGRNSRH